MQYTLADLEQSVYNNLDDNTRLYTQGEVDTAINEAVRVLNLFTGFIQGSVNISGGTQANRVFYDVPDGILFPLAVHLSDRQLRRCSIPVVATKYREWMSHLSAVEGPTSRWIPMGIRKFAIHPPEGTAAKVLKVTGVAEPTALSGATDVVEIPDEFTKAIIDLASHTLPLKEGGKIFADASLLYQEFLRKMKELGRWQKLKHPRYFVEIKSVKRPSA